VKIWEVTADKLSHERKDLFSWRWDARCDRTFIECIHNDVSRAMCVEGEHRFEAFNHGTVIGFCYPTTMQSIELGEYVTTGIGLSGKLNEEGRQQVMESLLVNIPEVKIEISDRGHPSVV